MSGIERSFLSVLNIFKGLFNKRRSEQRTGDHVRKRVLLIGNDPAMRALYETLFREHAGEIDCRFAKDGLHAVLGQIRRFPARFDLIVLNWNADGGDPNITNGHDILLSLRLLEPTRDLPVAVIFDRAAVHEAEVKLHGATCCFSETTTTEDVIRWMRIFIGVPSAKNERL